MKPTKKTGSTSASQDVSPNQPNIEISEFDGSFVEGNVWVKAGFSRNQNRILRALGLRLFRGKREPTACAVRMLVIWCLAHLNEIEDQLDAEVCLNWLDPLKDRRKQFTAVGKVLKALGVVSPRSARRN